MFRECTVGGTIRMSRLSWRMVTAAVFLLAVYPGTALEIEDDTLPGDMSLMFDDQDQEQNFVDYGPPMLPEMKPDMLGNFLMYKILSAYRKHDAYPIEETGLFPSTPTHPETFDLSLLKKPVLKRVTDVNRVAKVTPSKPAGQKWKTKKGKVGRRTQIICYFKLCAFRPPV